MRTEAGSGNPREEGGEPIDPDSAVRQEIEAIDPDNLDSVRSFAVDFDTTELQYKIAPATIDLLLDKIAMAAESYAREQNTHKRDETDPYDLERFFIMLYGRPFTPDVRSDHSRDNIQDIALRQALKKIGNGEHVEALSAFLAHSLLQNAQMIRPHVLMEAIEEVTDIKSRLNRFDPYRHHIQDLEQRMAGWTVWNLRFGDYIKSKLGELRSGNFSEAAKMLDLIILLFKTTRAQVSRAEYQRQAIEEAIEEIESSTDNYLISSRIRIIRELFKNYPQKESWQQAQGGEKDQFHPWYLHASAVGAATRKIAPGIYGTHSEEGRLGQMRKLPFFQFRHYSLLDERREEREEVGSGDLFPASSSDPSREQERAEKIRDFRFLQSLPMRQIIEEDFGVDLSEIDISAQIQLLNFLKTKSSKEVQEVAELTRGFGQDAMTAFLALDHSPEAHKIILQVAGNPDKNASAFILRKFSQIAARVKGTALFARGDRAVKGKIARGLLKRGVELLQKYADAPPDAQTAKRELEQIEVELLVFAETFRALKESGADIELEDFAKITIEVCPGAEVSPEDKVEMRQILEENWLEQSKEILSAIQPQFEEALGSNENRFYIIKYAGQIVAFQRFEERQEDGSLYAASNNVRQSVRGAKIGAAATEMALGQEARGRLVRADVWAKLPVAGYYLSPSLFICDGAMERAGEPFLKIATRDGQGNSPGDYERNSQEPHERTQKSLVCPLEPATSFIEAVNRKVAEGYVVTAIKHLGEDQAGQVELTCIPKISGAPRQTEP